VAFFLLPPLAGRKRRRTALDLAGDRLRRLAGPSGTASAVRSPHIRESHVIPKVLGQRGQPVVVEHIADHRGHVADLRPLDAR
jgi:hypothetical protein